MTDFHHLESRAKTLCESRHGPGSWEAKHRKRAFYREHARRQLESAKAPNAAAALLALLGYRRGR